MLLSSLAVVLAVCLVIALFARVTRPPEKQAGMKVVDAELSHRPLETRLLQADARERFLQAWAAIQPLFADEPEVALRETDRLIQDVMRECGYPTGDFGRVSEHVTTRQTDVLDNYRSAHRITVKGETTMLEPQEIERALAAFRAVSDTLVAIDDIEA